ncbi:MAG: hypothetical protein MO853_09480 [Candidatus Protistobacter heckmanni]|nr:hypothetical protein [Candidatus Protistobacter heckmanni]
MDNFLRTGAEFGRFDYFCTLASNALFFKPFSLDAVKRRFAQTPPHAPKYPLDALPDIWWWPTLARNPGVLAWFGERMGFKKLASSQIEVLIAARDDWALLAHRKGEFGDLLAGGAPGDAQAATRLPEHVCTLK